MTVVVDYACLSLSSQLLRRQAVHTDAMCGYVRRECSLTSGELGWVLGTFAPLNAAVVDGADQVFQVVRQVASYGAHSLDQTAARYEEADRSAYRELSRLAARLGTSLPPFTSPIDRDAILRSGELAPSDFADGEPSAFAQIVALPGDIRDEGRAVIAQAWDRGAGLTGAGVVVERSDAASYLVAPVGKTSELDSVRWSAGPLLGGLDWVFEEIFGYSLLEDVILKPLTGNWAEIREASVAWSNLGAATMAMGGNVTSLSSQTFAWRGDAADAFRLAMAAAGAAVIGLSYAADVVAGVVDKIGMVAELAAKGISAALNWIVTKLARMAAEASVPIAGWVVAAAETALLVFEISKWVRRIYALINLIIDSIEGAVQARVKLAQAALALEDLMEGLGRRAAQPVAG